MASLQPKTRVFTGMVTKMHDNFGFIDDDVFFQLGSCDGKAPSIGDRVMVEAQYNPNMPFKWHASQVKLVGRQQKPAASSIGGAARFNPRPQFPPQGLKFVPTGHGAGLLGAAPVHVLNQHLPQHRHQQMQGGKQRKRSAQNPPRPAARQHLPTPPVRKSKEADSKKRRTRSPPSHRRSPGHHTTTEKNSRRPAPRYMVQYFKRALTRKTSDALSLKHLYHSLYIPSDFFFVDYNWQESFTLKQQLSVGKANFHIFNKEVNSLVSIESNVLSPSDADHTWVAKVMLLQAPSKDETYQRCCKLAEDGSESFLHQSKIYKFLVGTKNKKEVMAIGGSWSPSLDGSDPGSNPLTLVNTAIRTCKALTGINLSKCTQWRRVLHIQYHRGAEVHKGRSVPDRVENTVIFLPDVHLCMPNAIEYESLRTSYAAECESHIKFEQEAALAESKIAEIPDIEVNQLEEQDNATATVSTDNNDEITDKKGETEVKAEGDESGKTAATPSKANASLDESMEVENDKAGDGLTPTHYSKLDIKTLKVQPLRKELEARGLSPRGLKSALIQRLTEALENEAKNDAEQAIKKELMEEEKQVDEEKGKDVSMQEEGEKTGSVPIKDEKVIVTGNEDQTKKEKSEDDEKTDVKKEEVTIEPKKPREVDAEAIRRHYVFPETHPVITVHPNQEYKKGNFDCSITSLSSLLAYRQVDNKESIFEVSVFAEAFSEMLQRGHAFNIYKALSNPLPQLKSEKEEKVKEDKSEAEGKKDEEDEDEPKAKKSKSENGKMDSEEKHDKSEEEKIEEAQDEADVDKKSSGENSQSQEGKGIEKTPPNDKDDKPEKHDHKKSSEKLEKMVTFRKDLLLSFVYFDTTQCGYIKSSDMRDILHSIGIGLSRNQITRLISEHVEHDNFKYRKLTDVPEPQLEAYKDLLKAAEKPDLDSLIAGNTTLAFKITVCNGTTKRSKPVVSDGIIMFNGAVVDVKSLQDTLANSEDSRSDLEAQLVKLKTDLDSTNKQLADIETEKKSLEWDFISTKKKLTETEVNLKSATEARNKFEKTLKNVAKNIENVLPKSNE